MADNFYTMQEVMEKLRKTEQEVQDLVKQGKLRQYMDAGKAMYKKDDIDSLSEEIVGLDISGIGIAPEDSIPDLSLEETSEIQLEPDESGPAPAEDEVDMEDLKSEGGFGLSQMGDLSMADTNVGTVGINILSGTDDAFRLTEDTKAETQADEEEVEEFDNLDADSNLESFGSGSGLLDLSLQADDTSLGAVLDDILPAGVDEGGIEGGELPVDQLGMADEPEDLLAEPAMSGGTAAPLGVEASPAAATAGAPGVAFVPVAQVDPRTNMFGVAMFLPLTAVILAAIILTAAFKGIRPSLLNMLVETQIAGVGLFWYVLGGLALFAVIFSLAASLGGGSSEAKPKKEKVKKEKARKEKKPKKEKVKKKK
jgi:hypothetical protein